MKVNNKCSDSFPVKRGVKQGSVLSPTLFIAVVDFLLSFLENSGQGLTVLGLNVGNAAHADDVRAQSSQHKCDCGTNTGKSHQCILPGKFFEAKCRQN